MKIMLLAFVMTAAAGAVHANPHPEGGGPAAGAAAQSRQGDGCRVELRSSRMETRGGGYYDSHFTWNVYADVPNVGTTVLVTWEYTPVYWINTEQRGRVQERGFSALGQVQIYYTQSQPEIHRTEQQAPSRGFLEDYNPSIADIEMGSIECPGAGR